MRCLVMFITAVCMFFFTKVKMAETCKFQLKMMKLKNVVTAVKFFDSFNERDEAGATRLDFTCFIYQ